MNVALAYCAGDREAAERLVIHTNQWYQSRHNLFLLAARGVEPVTAYQGWGSVTVLADSFGARSNWQSSAAIRDARGPNSMFRQFARYFSHYKKGPWLFMEPDAIPLCAEWVDRIEAEYLSAGKPYMGARISQPIMHMSGVGVYPQNTDLETTLILPMRDKAGIEIAFDHAGARAIIPRCHFTGLIQQEHWAEPFLSQAHFEMRISKEAVIYHPCKDGSIYQYLGASASAAEQSVDAAPFRPLKPMPPIDPKREAMLARMAKVRAARKHAKAKVA